MISDLGRPTWATLQEGVNYWRIDEATFRRWIKEGRVPAVRVGRQIRIRWSDLEALAERIEVA